MIQIPFDKDDLTMSQAGLKKIQDRITATKDMEEKEQDLAMETENYEIRPKCEMKVWPFRVKVEVSKDRFEYLDETHEDDNIQKLINEQIEKNVLAKPSSRLQILKADGNTEKKDIEKKIMNNYHKLRAEGHLDTEYPFYCNELKKANDFRFVAGYDVPLDKLYKMLATCVHNAINKFCPVLFEIVDLQLRE